jgi:hypothetical protein
MVAVRRCVVIVDRHEFDHGSDEVGANDVADDDPRASLGVNLRPSNLQHGRDSGPEPLGARQPKASPEESCSATERAARTTATRVPLSALAGIEVREATARMADGIGGSQVETWAYP